MSEDIKYIILIGIVFIAISVVMLKSWDLGNDRKDYSIVCLDGHQYYKASFFTKGFLAIKLDIDGKPVPCLVNTKK